MPPATLATWTVALAGFALASLAVGQTQQVYRYVDADGHVIYSDRPPPPGAKDVQPKRLGANFIESDVMSLEVQQVTERFPVTLYTFDCGDVCQNAEGFLNKRGVPYSTIDVAQPEGNAKLKALTGEQAVPVLQVGDKMLSKGFSELRWSAMLDEAGYPKTPGYRRVQAAKPADIKAVAPLTQTAPTASQRGGDYPK